MYLGTVGDQVSSLSHVRDPTCFEIARSTSSLSLLGNSSPSSMPRVHPLRHLAATFQAEGVTGLCKVLSNSTAEELIKACLETFGV